MENLQIPARWANVCVTKLPNIEEEKNSFYLKILLDVGVKT